jgi:hypothetical protein
LQGAGAAYFTHTDPVNGNTSLINELPIWPFDAGTLRTFLTAYVVAILVSAVAASRKGFVSSIWDWLTRP